MKRCKKFLEKCKALFLKKRVRTKVEVGTFHGIGARPDQEDSFYVSDYMNGYEVADKGFVAAVADGMGGLSGGAKTSATVTAAIKDFYEHDFVKQKEEQKLPAMLDYIDGRVKQMQEVTGEKGGSTLSAVWINGRKLHFLSVGDSRIYLLRDGTISQINREHTVEWELLERLARDEIDMETYQSIQGKKALTSYIGQEEIEETDYSKKSLVLQKEDVIFLASDGVFGTLSNEEIKDVIEKKLKKYDCMKAAEELQKEIEKREKKKQDNYTGIVIRCVNKNGLRRKIR